MILMDEPARLLDPNIHVKKLEELMQELKLKLPDRHRHPQHAAGPARVSDYTAMMMIDEQRAGRHDQYDGPTSSYPSEDKPPEDYVYGRFG